MTQFKSMPLNLGDVLYIKSILMQKYFNDRGAALYCSLYGERGVVVDLDYKWNGVRIQWKTGEREWFKIQ